MKIKVLGTGCARCKALFVEAEKAAAAAGFPVEVEKVEQIQQIMTYKVMSMPALVVDGRVKAEGRVPASTEIVAWIKAAGSPGNPV